MFPISNARQGREDNCPNWPLLKADLTGPSSSDSIRRGTPGDARAVSVMESRAFELCPWSRVVQATL